MDVGKGSFKEASHEEKVRFASRFEVRNKERDGEMSDERRERKTKKL